MWFHTTRHDTTRHDTTRHDTTRHDTTRHDTTRHDTTRHDTTRHDTTRHDTTPYHTIPCIRRQRRIHSTVRPIHPPASVHPDQDDARHSTASPYPQNNTNYTCFISLTEEVLLITLIDQIGYLFNTAPAWTDLFIAHNDTAHGERLRPISDLMRHFVSRGQRTLPINPRTGGV